MQLYDTEIRPHLEEALRAAWVPTNLRPDAPRTQTDSTDLPDIRIDLTEFTTQGTGRASGARDVVIPHTYVCTGRFAYPLAGSYVNTEAVAKVNAALAVLTTNWPRFAGWAFSEEIAGEIRDNVQERVYEVELTLVIEVICPAQYGG